MKVFIGCLDIATILSGLAEGFRNAGHLVTTYVSERNPFYSHISYDIIKEPFFKSRLRYPNKNYPDVVKGILKRSDDLISYFGLQRLNDKIINDHDLFNCFADN